MIDALALFAPLIAVLTVLIAESRDA